MRERTKSVEEATSHVECDAGDPTFIQLARRPPSLPDRQVPAPKGCDLVARIDCPSADSLVRGHLPVFGTASGTDFASYDLAYKGSGPHHGEWHTFNVGYEPVVSDRKLDHGLFDTETSVAGNLGTLDTGLTAYTYWTHEGPANDLPQGNYLIRLRVFDKTGGMAEHIVPVTVGRVVTNGRGGEVISPDGQVQLVVAPRSLTKRIVVFACVPVRSEEVSEAASEAAWIPGQSWEIRPPGTEFLEPVTLRLGGQEAPVVWMIWDGVAKQWYRLGNTSDRDHDMTVRLSRLPPGRCIVAAFEPTPALALVPLHYRLVAGDQDATVAQGKTVEGWKPMHGKWGARLARKSEDGREFVRMTNMRNPGTFAASVGIEPFQPDTTPIVSFDYRFSAGLKLNLGLITKDYCYEIRLTGEDRPYSRVGMNLIGRVPDVLADGTWRHVEVDLREFPSLRSTAVERVVFWNWENQGILKLALGSNPVDATADIDDFEVRPAPAVPRGGVAGKGSSSVASEPLWSIGKRDGSAGEFCHEADAIDDFRPDQPCRRFGRALTEKYPKARIRFAVPDQDVPVAAVLDLSAAGFDDTIGGRVSVGVTLNDEPMQLVVFDRRAARHHCVPLSGLRAGVNTLLLERLEGGDWIAWDALELVPVAAADPVSLAITFDKDAPSELEVGDGYVLGQPGVFLQRACTETDPSLTICFYLEADARASAGHFELKVRSRAAAMNAPMGAQVRVTANDSWVGETWFPPSGRELTVPVLPEQLRSGWNRITLRWVAGSEWVLWDRVALTEASPQNVPAESKVSNE